MSRQWVIMAVVASAALAFAGAAEASTKAPAAGGSPPLPARHDAAPNHHAALRPVPHGAARNSARNRTGSHGAATESLAGVAALTAMGRLDLNPLPPPISQEDRATWGRGPPRAGPHQDARFSPLLGTFARSASIKPQRLTIRSSRSQAHGVLSRDRLESRPNASRLEGAVVCPNSPSLGDPV